MARDSDSAATIKTITYKGRAVPLLVDGRGVFYASLAEERIEAKSLDGLHDKVKRAIDRMGKIRIPVTMMACGWYDEKPEFTDALLTGYHQRRRTPVLMHPEDGTELSCYHDDLCRRLTQIEKQNIIAAWRSKRRAEKHYEDLDRQSQGQSRGAPGGRSQEDRRGRPDTRRRGQRGRAQRWRRRRSLRL